MDGLNTSAYLLDTAKEHIEGKITIDEAQRRIHSYYEQQSTRTELEVKTREADIVSARITKLLGEKAFQFSPAEWLSIHRRLFEGVFDHAGRLRQGKHPRHRRFHDQVYKNLRLPREQRCL